MTYEKQEQLRLIKNAREGSADALSLLCDKYKPLMEAEVRRHTDPEMSDQDIADLREEALISFCSSVCNYDDTVENVEFGLYAKICIGNALVSFLRCYNKYKGRVVSIDDVSVRSAEHISDPLQILIEEESFSKLKRDIQKNLSSYESRVWWLYVSGMSAADIAKKLDSKDKRKATK